MDSSNIKRITLLTVNISLFVVIIGAGFLLSVFYPKQTVSQEEQRALAAFPKYSFDALFSGEYTKGISEYFTDVFPFRAALVSGGAFLDDLMGFRYDDVKIYAYNESTRAGGGSGYEAAASAVPIYTPPVITEKNETENEAEIEEEIIEEAPIIENPYEELEGEQDGAVFLIGDTGLEVFGGNKDTGLRYADTINNFAARQSDALNIYVLIAPSAVEFLLPTKYKEKGLSNPQKVQFDNIKDALSQRVSWVYSYESIEKRALSEYCFFRTDHHWTQRGAYYGYTAFCDAASLDAYPIDTYDINIAEGYLGTLYRQTKDTRLQQNPDDVEKFIMPPEEEKQYTVMLYIDDETAYEGRLVSPSPESYYLAFINGDVPYTKIQGPNQNGRKLLVIKESFGNALVPFLPRHYEEVHVADIRTFPYEADSFIKDNGITDVLFVCSMFSANTSVMVDRIERVTG